MTKRQTWLWSENFSELAGSKKSVGYQTWVGKLSGRQRDSLRPPSVDSTRTMRRHSCFSRPASRHLSVRASVSVRRSLFLNRSFVAHMKCTLSVPMAVGFPPRSNLGFLHLTQPASFPLLKEAPTLVSCACFSRTPSQWFRRSDHRCAAPAAGHSHPDLTTKKLVSRQPICSPPLPSRPSLFLPPPSCSRHCQERPRREQEGQKVVRFRRLLPSLSSLQQVKEDWATNPAVTGKAPVALPSSY